MLNEALDSLRRCMTADPRDWSIYKRDAWAYGLVVGWGHAMSEVARTHGWTAEEVERLRKLHKSIVSARRKRNTATKPPHPKNKKA